MNINIKYKIFKLLLVTSVNIILKLINGINDSIALLLISIINTIIPGKKAINVSEQNHNQSIKLYGAI